MAHWWQTIPWRMVQTNLPDRAMADMDAARFARDLKDFGATVVNLNAAGIVANYETKLDFQPRNPYLTGDSLADVVAACHAQGIRVIARTDFSRIQRAVYEQHPDWAARLADGRILDYNGYVSVCPNSAYLNEAMFAVLRELFAAIPFDGLYCNMSSVFLTDYDGNFHGVCRCERCRALYEQETGQPAPEAANPRDPALGPYVSFQMKRSARHKAKLKAFLKELDPELALDGVDFLRSEVSLDYDRPNWVYKASSNARMGAGPERARPSDDASVDFLGFRHRYISAPPALMALRQWQNLANAGSLSLYIMGRLDARRDTSALAPTRRVFQFHKAHEKVFRGLRSAAQVVLLQTGSWQRMEDEARGWVRVLTESHIPFDEILLASLQTAAQLAGKRLAILPDAPRLTGAQAALLDEFVEAGGILLATGGTAQGTGSARLACLGIEQVQEVRKKLRSSMLEIPAEEAGCFPRCADTPYLDFGETLWCVQHKPQAKACLQLIPEHPFGPSEACWFEAREAVPGLVAMSYGKGRGVYLPWKGAAVCVQTGTDNPLRCLQDVLFEVCGLPDLAPGLTPMVELTLTQKTGLVAVQLVNESGCFGNSWCEPLPVRDIRLKLPGVRGQAKTLNGGRVKGRITGDGLELELDILREYEAIVIDTVPETPAQ